ncbi:type II secretion system minor pseudopilin GspH [Psychromonas hadalis]|uniref:type II secretion system minor pseudopilin GspH n=1 Tax=Psychromonas hadalis TaxID=211669 RepID=UPI0003B5D6CF|nr:type II secretion system minor pseudopilin GspH [Psychromonas hadalis]
MLQKSSSSLLDQRGFTLLEIMLVLVLIGMASAGVMMTMPNNISNNDNVDWQAQRFSTLLQFAEDEALISGKELALVFNDNTYRFAFYDYPSKKWIALASEQIGKVIELPESINFEYTLIGSVWDEIETEDEDVFIDETYLVQIDGDENEVKSFSPQVYIMSSGEVTPFRVLFSENATGPDKRSSLLQVSMSGMIIRMESDKQ